MKAKEIIQKVQNETGLSSYAFAKEAGVSPSTITRIINGKAEPTFDNLNDWLNSVGYSLSLDKVQFDPNKPTLDDLVKILETPSYDVYYWFKVVACCKDLLEYYAYESYLKPIDNQGDSIINQDWKAFYAGFVEYFSKVILKKDYPYWTSKKKYVTRDAWVPVGKLPRIHTPFLKNFAQHNVYLPAGELQWL
jgi:transcriptional regulator with XRE-family HTH domain